MKIMVVEDDKYSRTYLKRALEAHGYESVTYANGAEALKACRLEKPGLIISDIMMPEMDGYIFCKKVKNDDLLKEIPFILYTATYISHEDEELGLSLGASRYLTKPMEMKDLLSCIQDALKECGVAETQKQDGIKRKPDEIDKMHLDVVNKKLQKKVQDLEIEHQALLSEKSKNDLILATAGVGILGLDKDGKHSFVNSSATAMLGYSEHELIGKPSHGCWHYRYPDGTKYPETESTIYETLRTGKVYSGESHFVRKDGTLFPVYCTSQAMVEKGEILGAVVSFMDITERKNLEEQLRQAQKLEAVGVLAGGVAHDFNNLISVITCYSQLLEMELKPDDPILETIHAIHKAGTRAESLTRQLLIFSRKGVVDIKIFKFSSIVYDMEKMVRRLVGENIELIIDVINDNDYIKADQGQIEQVIMNLAVNARDALSNGGKIVIKSRNLEIKEPVFRQDKSFESGQYLKISVSDTGCGMSEENMEHIFEPFFTTKTKEKGTGLGLYIVSGIIKESNGFVDVYSKLGEGTTFEICFPLVKGSGKEIKETKICEDSLQGNETILVAEDDDLFRGAICKTLRGKGYNVIEASHGGIALLKSEQYKENIHLALCDIVMPELSGPQLVKRLKPIHPEMKVIFMSGYIEDVRTKNEIAENQRSFLQKPFSVDSLLKKVRDVLREQILLSIDSKYLPS